MLKPPKLLTGLFSPVFFFQKLTAKTCVAALGHALRHTTVLLLISLIPLSATAQAILLPTTQLLIGSQEIQVEIAATEPARTNGLMHRTSLPPNHGMLFIFEHTDRHCFWMKNTPLPLSIAFIDDNGAILNIAAMMPFSEQVHCPIAPIAYALEMEQGWFAQHSIGAGQHVSNLPKR